MLNPRKNTKRKAPDETGFDHPVVFPRRLRAACFSAIGVTTAVALIIVGLFANVGLSFLPVPGLGLPSAPKTSAVAHSGSATWNDTPAPQSIALFCTMLASSVRARSTPPALT